MRPLIDHWSLALEHPAHCATFRHHVCHLVVAGNVGWYQLQPEDIEHGANCCERLAPAWALIPRILPPWLSIECWDGEHIIVAAEHVRRQIGSEPLPVPEADEAPPARRRGTQQLLEAVMARHRAVIRRQEREDRRRGLLE